MRIGVVCNFIFMCIHHAANKQSNPPRWATKTKVPGRAHRRAQKVAESGPKNSPAAPEKQSLAAADSLKTRAASSEIPITKLFLINR